MSRSHCQIVVLGEGQVPMPCRGLCRGVESEQGAQFNITMLPKSMNSIQEVKINGPRFQSSA